MTITNIVLCLIAGISFAYGRMKHAEVHELIDEMNDLAYRNYDLELKNRILSNNISQAIKEADENESW